MQFNIISITLLGSLAIVLGGYAIYNAFLVPNRSEQMKQASSSPPTKNIGKGFKLFIGVVLISIGVIAIISVT